MKKKQIKTLFLALVTITSIFGNTMLVTATEVKNAEHPVKAEYIDDKGNKVTVYETELDSKDAMAIPKKDYYSTLSNNNTNGISLFSAKKQAKRAVYTSYIQPYNNRSYVMAHSVSTEGIEKMSITCTAYYSLGKKAGTKSGTSLHGGKWRTLAYSVTVKGINRKLCSAKSTHWYYDKTFGDKKHNRTWKK